MLIKFIQVTTNLWKHISGRVVEAFSLLRIFALAVLSMTGCEYVAMSNDDYRATHRIQIDR